jgi:hypothetical protein
MLSPTTGGAWITSVAREETPAHREGWADELEPEPEPEPELFVHSYFSGPEMTTAQAENVEALRQFRDDNLSQIDMTAEDWPRNRLDRLAEVTDLAIWEPGKVLPQAVGWCDARGAGFTGIKEAYGLPNNVAALISPASAAS